VQAQLANGALELSWRIDISGIDAGQTFRAAGKSLDVCSRELVGDMHFQSLELHGHDNEFVADTRNMLMEFRDSCPAKPPNAAHVFAFFLGVVLFERQIGVPIDQHVSSSDHWIELKNLVDPTDGSVMSGRRPPIKGYFQRCAGRGCGHVFGLFVRRIKPPGPDVVR
jgi:hypothetical protein